MKYLLSRFIQFILALFIMSTVALIAFITLVDPNQFKGTIQNTILTKSGRTLIIEGPIQWKIEKGLALEVDSIKINNRPPYSEDYITVKHLRITPNFWSMVTGQLALNIKLDDITFNLETPTFIHTPSEGTLQGEVDLNLENRNLDTWVLNGLFQGQQIQLGKFLFSKIKFDLHAKNELFVLPQFELTTTTGGRHLGMLKVDFKNDNPSFVLNDESTEIEMNELLTGFDQPQKLEGRGTLKLSLASLGNTLEELKHHLSGHIIFSVTHGKILGLSLNTLLSDAQNAITRTQNAFSENKDLDVAQLLIKELAGVKLSHQSMTEFDTLKANLYFEEGVLNNPNLILLCPHYTVNGKGTLDLIQNTLHYQSNIELKKEIENKTLSLLKGNPLTVLISGNVNNPSIKPSFEHLIKSIPKKPADASTLKTLENLFETQ